MPRTNVFGPLLSQWSVVRRSALALCAVLISLSPLSALAAEPGTLVVTTANREQGEIPINEQTPHRAEITVWNLYESGLPSRARITDVVAGPATDQIRELFLWNLIEPMEWAFLDNFPNLERLTITGMTFERGLLFEQGAPVRKLSIGESSGLGATPEISLGNFPNLREFAYFVFETETIPSLSDIPSSLETVTFLFSEPLELRSVPDELRALASVSQINISPLNALPTIHRQVPQLQEDLGPFQ